MFTGSHANHLSSVGFALTGLVAGVTVTVTAAIPPRRGPRAPEGRPSVLRTARTFGTHRARVRSLEWGTPVAARGARPRATGTPNYLFVSIKLATAGSRPALPTLEVTLGMGYSAGVGEYSKVGDELRTPGGCRIDRGRCFTSIIGHAFGKYLIFTFGDGSIYTLEGPVAQQTIGEFARVDPGCFWNRALGGFAVSEGFHRGEPNGGREFEWEAEVVPPPVPTP